MATSPREMIATNTPSAIGITNVVMWVKITKHTNPYITNPKPKGLLRIHEVGLDGQIIRASFSENGTKPFVMVDARSLRFKYRGF